MDEVIRCDCGFEARAADEEALVAEVRRHAWEAHRMELTPQEALLLAFRAEMDANTSAATPHSTTHESERRSHETGL